MTSRKLKESEKKIIASNQEWKCKICTKILSSTYQVDHIVPFSITQNDTANNLQALCVSCHCSKTQNESTRISRFKKMCSNLNQTLCWFCLEQLDDRFDTHMCDKILHPIKLESSNKKSKQVSFSSVVDKFIHTKDDELESKMNSLNFSTMNDLESLRKWKQEFPCKLKMCSSNNDHTTLVIKICTHHIMVNNFFTCSQNLTLENVVEAIRMATNNEMPNKYTSVLFEIHNGTELDEDVPEELIDHINHYLPPLLDIDIPIFKQHCDIDYTFICY